MVRRSIGPLVRRWSVSSLEIGGRDVHAALRSRRVSDIRDGCLTDSVFVGYSRSDTRMATLVVEPLRGSRRRVLRCRQHSCRRALARCPCSGDRQRQPFLPVVVRSFGWFLEVQSEYERAISGKKRLVPVLLDSTPLINPLTEYQWVDFRGVVEGHKPPTRRHHRHRHRVTWGSIPEPAVGRPPKSAGRKSAGNKAAADAPAVSRPRRAHYHHRGGPACLSAWERPLDRPSLGGPFGLARCLDGSRRHCRGTGSVVGVHR